MNLKFKVHSPEHSKAIAKRLKQLKNLPKGDVVFSVDCCDVEIYPKYMYCGDIDKATEATLNDLYNQEFLEEMESNELVLDATTTVIINKNSVLIKSSPKCENIYTTIDKIEEILNLHKKLKK